MVEKLRFGLVGCGVIGPFHARALDSLPDVELCAVTDCVAERAQKLAGQHGARAYTDLAEMLARESLDVVTICTPSGLHGEHACQAMRAGKHVIVEKPMEIHPQAIEQMLRVQAEQQVKLAVISQHRFDPAVSQVRALVEEGAFGRLVLGNAIIPWWRSQGYYDSGTWRGTWELDGGGILMNQSIHYIDLLQWMMGPVSSIRAYSATLAHRIETEDVATAVLRFASGALGTISATTGAYPGLAARLELLGAKGSAVIEGDELSFLHLARSEQKAAGAYGAGRNVGKIERSTSAPSAASDPAALAWRSHALQIADMVRALREGGEPLINGHAGRQSVEIILGIYEAARTGQEVSL
ncbi:MAG TPA: Gfo/Idh/MocA family oxidoreductase [Ktedonobacteraceae bacterium]